ncbi:MAG: hypothetical protein K6G51_06200 [Sphaerochaetaceae bacterium]|nr:hypothetical protein [Sphaerochaetaceae bacterium]
MIDAEKAIEKLLEGNKLYVKDAVSTSDVSSEIRVKTTKEGQSPFAIVIACSDSRVIPEAIFSCGIGDLFVIRVAGNVLDRHQLGSIEYAVEHLGTNLVMVLGHTHCGAIEAALHHQPEGYIGYIVTDIRRAIRKEKDPYKASCLNVKHCVNVIEKNLEISEDEKSGVRVVGAIYDIETGKVELI